jgi:hypothetical protein
LGCYGDHFTYFTGGKAFTSDRFYISSGTDGWNELNCAEHVLSRLDSAIRVTPLQLADGWKKQKVGFTEVTSLPLCLIAVFARSTESGRKKSP